MTPTIILGLSLQLVALGIVFAKLRGRWISHTGAYFVVAATVVYGLTEIVQSIFPQYAIYRALITTVDIDRWILIASGAILFFSVAYVFTLSANHWPRPDAPPRVVAKHDLPPWQIMVTLSIIGIMGVFLGGSAAGAARYWINGMTQDFLLFAIVITTLTYSISTQNRSFLAVFVLQSVVSALLVSRTAVLVCAIMFISTLVRYRIPIRKRDFALVSLLVVVLITSISAARSIVGREQLQGNLTERVNGLLQGGQSLTSESTADPVLQDFVYRFDGNAFPALVGAQFERGRKPVGTQPLRINLFLMVPQFLNPGKIDTIDTLRNEALYIITVLGLPSEVPYLPSTLGVLYASFGAIGLLAITSLFGVLFALVDVWIHQGLTLIRVLVGMALTYSVLTMDVGLIWYFINLRAILAIFAALTMVKLIRLTLSGVHRSAGYLN